MNMKILTVVSIATLKEGGGNAERAIQLTYHLSRLSIESSLLTLDIGDLKSLKIKYPEITFYIQRCINRRFQIPAVSLKTILQAVNNCDHLHFIGFWSILSSMVLIIALIKKKKWVISPSGALPIFGRSKIFKYLYNIAFGNILIRKAAVNIAITNNEKNDFIKYKINTNNIAIIPNGINLEKCNDGVNNKIFEEYNFDRKRYILFMGRINKIKGPDLLLDAFIKLSEENMDLNLIFAGSDEGLLSELKNKVNNFNLNKRVFFSGFLTGPQKDLIYQNCSLLVIPSRLEAMSIVALEAGLFCKPVLATNVCGIEELFFINENLCAEPNATSLYIKLRNLFKDDISLASYGIEWNKIVIDKYNWLNSAQSLSALFNKIE